MDFPKNLQTCDDVLALERLNHDIEAKIWAVIQTLRPCNLYKILEWNPWYVARSGGSTNDLSHELRKAGIQRCVKPFWEVPDDGSEEQLWVHVRFQYMTHPDHTLDEREMSFPARYLFLDEDAIVSAWQAHLNKYGHKVLK